MSPGVAVGRAVLWVSREDSSPKRALEPEEIEPEIERFRRAAESAAHEIESTARHVKESLGAEYAGIFQAHALFLKDRTFLGPIERRIAHEKVNAEWAVTETTADLSARFRSLPDEDFAHHGADIDDVARILKKHLGGEEYSRLRMEDLVGEAIVLVADELTPSDAVRIPRDRVVGFVTERGGRTSHAAILARSFGIPAVVGVPQLLAEVGGGRPRRGRRSGRTRLARAVRERCRALPRAPRPGSAPRGVAQGAQSRPHHPHARRRRGFRAREHRAPERDPRRPGIRGGRGGPVPVGVLSTFPEGDEFPSEEEQSLAYREVLEGLAPRPVVIRTYDLGGKKGAHHLVGYDEVNPVLGLRGVRLCFARPEMFSTQLRALLAAAGSGNLRLLVPMVSGVEEIRRVRILLKKAREDVLERGIAVPDDIPLGAMIEVPSAAMTADLLAPEVDFLSLGTNDLIQYTLAVDRANETVSDLFRPTHPAVLRLVARVADAARTAQKPLSVCGEMAADPALVLLFLGLGIREFSMGPRTVPVLKEFLRGVSTRDAERVAQAALSMSTADEVSSFLAQELRDLRDGRGMKPRTPGG